MSVFQDKPFVIAEMSGNHNQSLERALELVDIAAECGAHALKIQTYTPDTITMDHDQYPFVITDERSLWKGRKLYDLYAEAMTPWEWHKAIFERGKEKGILVFSSPFDETAVDFLETLDAPIYKIASFENNHLPLIKKVAQTGKPVIISSGTSNLAQLSEAIDTLKNNGCPEIVVLKCTSTYPATPEHSNILTIPHMLNLFGCRVGLSDHTAGIGVSVAAVALGATVIEKHFTIRRSDGGVDSAFSIEPDELRQLVIETERAYLALGHVQYDVQEIERNSLQFKRSVFATTDIAAGELLTTANTKVIRPSGGLEPKYHEIVLGKPAKAAIAKGSPITWESI